MQQISWADLPGNKYLKKLEPAMLTKGCVVKQTIKKIGAKRGEAPQLVKVVYDRDYVVARLLVDVIQPLQIKSVEQLHRIIDSVWYEINNTNVDYDDYKAG